MSFTTLESTPLEIDLLELAKTTGWRLTGSSAIHERCNAGSMYLLNYPLTSGVAYEFSYAVKSISGGKLVAYLGDAGASEQTTAGFKVETMMASGENPVFRFFSDADVELTSFAIRPVAQSVELKQQNAIAWSEEDNKWGSFYTYNPDCGYAMFTNLYTFKQGRAYVHKHNTSLRNNYYGVQYKSILKLAANSQPQQTKTFQSIALQSNHLMVTTDDGIQTSLGQVSDLISEDFLKDVLKSGVKQVQVYDKEGVYSARFLRDKNSPDGILNGDALKGNYATIELMTTDNQMLRLFSVAVHWEPSHIGVR